MQLKSFFLATLLAFSALASAQSLKMEMIQMNMQLAKLGRANTVEEFHSLANNFIQTTEKAKTILPNGVEGNKAATEDYQTGMQKLIDVVKQADEKAQSGNLQEARITVYELEILKREYHQKYK